MLTIAEPTTDTVAGRRASAPAVEVIDVTQRSQDRTTLHDVSFSVAEGEVVALVGGSGAAQLRLPAGTGPDVVDRTVDETLAALDLAERANVRVGSLSGGQRKRANGFIVVHPDGIPVGRTRGGVWNGGVCCGVATREEVDDVAFVAALLDRLGQAHDIDPARTLAFGHSNGGTPGPGPRRGRRPAPASPMPATTPRRRSCRSCSPTPGREPRRSCGLHSCSDQACSGGEGSLAEQPPGPSGDDDPFAIDTDTATPARVLNYLAGGDVNFAADRELAEQLGDALPGGIDTARAAVRTLSAFMGRAVRYLAGEAGIAQFVNVGAGVPTVKKVHEVAQQAAPGSRFVYVGDDPVVLAHAHTLRSSTGGNVSTYVDGNLRNPQEIIRHARETLDFDEPVAVLLLTTLNFVPDEDDPYGLVAELLEPLPAGSCLAIAHASFDLGDEGMHKAAERLDKAIRQDYVVRSRDEIARFFDGLELAHPGLVQIDSWRPYGRPSPAPQDRPTPVYAGVGRRP